MLLALNACGEDTDRDAGGAGNGSGAPPAAMDDASTPARGNGGLADAEDSTQGLLPDGGPDAATDGGSSDRGPPAATECQTMDVTPEATIAWTFEGGTEVMQTVGEVSVEGSPLPERVMFTGEEMRFTLARRGSTWSVTIGYGEFPYTWQGSLPTVLEEVSSHRAAGSFRGEITPDAPGTPQDDLWIESGEFEVHYATSEPACAPAGAECQPGTVDYVSSDITARCSASCFFLPTYCGADGAWEDAQDCVKLGACSVDETRWTTEGCPACQQQRQRCNAECEWETEQQCEGPAEPCDAGECRTVVATSGTCAYRQLCAEDCTWQDDTGCVHPDSAVCE